MPARARPGTKKGVAKSDKQSGAKAKAAAKRTDDANEQAQGDVRIPLTPDGRPMTKIKVSAAELVPTGQYANVSIGPVQVEMFVDLEDPDPITDEQKENLANVLNQICEVVEGDVVAVQRDIVINNLED